MKKNFKKFFLFLALLALVSLARFPYQRLGTSIFQSIKSNLGENNIEFSAHDAILSFPAILKFTQAELAINSAKKPIKIKIDEAEFQLSLLKILLLKQVIDAKFEAFRGAGQMSLSRSLLSGTHQSSFNLSNLDLGKLPLKLEGKIGGTASIEGSIEGDSAEKTKTISDVLANNNFNADLRIYNAHYTGGDYVASILKLPKADHIKIEAETRLKKRKLELSYLSAFSSLGAIQGSGTATIGKNGNAEKMNFKFSLKFTESGAKTFVGYLALAANLPTDTPVKNWEISVSKKTGDLQPQFKAFPNQTS